MKTPSVADLLDQLFKRCTKPDGREYSCQEVSKALGGELEASYIAKVRRGAIKNPGREALAHLCLFFQVPPSYFFPEVPAPELAASGLAERPMELLQVALRALDLDPAVQHYVEGIVVALRPKADPQE